MRWYTVNASRPAYYDRTPTTFTQVYGAAAVAPHAATQRWSYTVPSNKKSYAQSMCAELMRDAAAGAAGIAQAYSVYTPVGGAATGIIISEEITNTVGGPNKAFFSSTGLLVAGDVLAGNTRDASTTGTYSYHVNAWYVEFDA